MKKSTRQLSDKTVSKTPTGIQGLDEITFGGLPKGRPTLICGGAGCGKTILAMEFLVRGATQYNEPGVFMAFEETDEELITNVASLGFDLDDLVHRKKMVLDYVYIERREIEETGEYDLEGLFIRLGHAIESIGAKRVVLDTIESLFAGLTNQFIVRAELRRLLRWLKEKGVTAIITGERAMGTLTRHGLEEYVSDCVIVLDHRVSEQSSTRRLQVLKYRGALHGTNEYPFLIDEHGFSVFPVTSLGLQSIALTDRISSGIPALDQLFEGKGYYRGSTILVSGPAGTGKTSIAALFAEAACTRGERALYFCFEESSSQIMRNMSSIGIDLESWITNGVLQFHATRPTLYSLEKHLAVICKCVETFDPQVVILDPINTPMMGENAFDVKMMLLRLLDFLKIQGSTALFTNLTIGGTAAEHTDVAISSLIDTWLLLQNLENNGERNRGIYVLKSRGMNHSNQIREFLLTDHGVQLREAYIGARGVLTGSARVAQEAQEKAERLVHTNEVDRQQRDIVRKRKIMDAQIAMLKSEFDDFEAERLKAIELEHARADLLKQDRNDMARSRNSIRSKK